MPASSENALSELLTRGVEEIIDKKHLEQQLKGKKKLRVKLGIDPTSPNIHIGRAVVLWKLRAFQDLGHAVVFIVGNFTGLVGDASDKDSERPMTSEAELKKNLKTYFNQASKIIDPKKAEMLYNSEWLKKLGFAEIARLASLFGLHDFEAREVIARRMKAGKRVSLHELMYPLMQGYDSVAVKADVELGGTDQKFNLLAGRVIQKSYAQPPQDILMTKILEGTDGRKMSSSWGNVINITDEPNDMFGKVMSISDNLIERYFTLATSVPLSKIQSVIKTYKNPRDQKLELAAAITEMYHGNKAAEQAKENFIAQFSKGELPKDIIERKVKANQLVEVLVETNLASSKSDARRLLLQGGVKVDGRPIKVWGSKTILKSGSIIQVGKRKFIKLV